MTLKLYRLPYCFINNSALEQAILPVTASSIFSLIFFETSTFPAAISSNATVRGFLLKL